MENKITHNSEEGKYNIHGFIKKVFQKDTFNKLIEYISWRKNIQNQEDTNVPILSPTSINLDLTTNCTYSCTHCIDFKVKERKAFLSFDCLKKLIDYWYARDLKSVIIIGGGEPLIHPDFEDIVAYLKSKHLQGWEFQNE